MDLQEQLKKLFPNHIPSEENADSNESDSALSVQKEPLICKYEKRNGRPITVIEGYEGTGADFKQLAKMLKTRLSVGGSIKNGQLILQGDYRNQIMEILKETGFKTKRVGG